jgi:hypothetical protein
VRAKAFSWLEPLGLLPVALLATATLWWPESGDQALFVLSAQRMHDGAVYYRDLWDVKQPGLYWFYQLGGLLVPGGLGARLLEALLAVVGAALVQLILTDRELRRGVRRAAPIMVLGPYLAYSYLVGVGQIEGLMNGLLLVVLAATWPGGGRLRPGWAWFVAGLTVGTVVLLKTVYAPIPLVPLAVAAGLSFRIERRAAVLRSGLALLGAALPVLLGLAYLLAHGVFAEAMHTTFVLPRQIATLPAIHNPASRLELQRAVKNMFPAIGPLAGLGLITARRRGTLAMDLTLLATAAVAFALAVPQLWTTYRWLMFAVPLGLLAVGGLDAALSWISERSRTSNRAMVLGLRTFGVLALAALTVPMLRGPGTMALTASGHPWGLDQRSRIARGQDLDPVTHPLTMAAPVAGRVPAGSKVAVLGDPRILMLLHAEQATAVSGWSLHQMPASVWTELGAEMERSQPQFVFVDARDWGQSPSAGLYALLRRQYRTIDVTPDGSWYESRS